MVGWSVPDGVTSARADTGQLLGSTIGPADGQGPWAGFRDSHVSRHEPHPLFFVLNCPSMRQKCTFPGPFGKAGKTGTLASLSVSPVRGTTD